ncbi:hypothetical protein [Ancylobacter oerskovii]|uniref:Uncharacterized protein n=1 Tax=Ancylobacter oerskovii TaxID=459519 RepID=A0ABW4YU56_9HYPH|nr:hypothetical protein [Ancylobacter oerskovii]MBS7544649.1 hypothetical protein [Ancylobacter oerskovii]
MAKQASSALKSVQNEVPPFRTFTSRPTELFSSEFLDHVRATGTPETFPGLYLGKIHRDEEFVVLKRFEIERKRRVDGKLAFCPRCHQHDKYLRGDLAWFPSMMVCAAIGNCCAGHDAGTKAAKEFKAKRDRDFRESYLLEHLPLMAAKLAAVAQLEAAAKIAGAIYRQFRLEVPKVHSQLRAAKANYGGHLVVSHVLGGENPDVESDYVGPAGFGRRTGVETQETILGLMTGQIALAKDWAPEKELASIRRFLGYVGSSFTDQQALDFILENPDRELDTAVELLRAADGGYSKLAARLREFWSFFTPDNIALINAYGIHEDGPLNVQVGYFVKNGVVDVRFKTRDQFCHLRIEQGLMTVRDEWPEPLESES